jgi:hypothetical protein
MEHGIWNESDDITYGKRGKYYLIFFGDEIFWEGGGGWLGGGGVGFELGAEKYG